MRTRFTELVRCAVPIQLAPMGGVGTAELIDAVTGAGGMGMTAMPGAPAPAVASALDDLRRRVAGPLGFNVLLPFLDPEVVDAAAERVPYVDFFHGPVDAGLVERVHRHGALAGWQVGSLDDAQAAVDAGADLLVARGIEGGGRMYGVESLWPLLDGVLDAVDVPVLAAGGIATGRGLAAALAAGASGVRMGTRFVATIESGAHPRYKESVRDAVPGDSLLTEEFGTMWPSDVRTARVLRRSIEAAARAPDGDPVARTRLGPDLVEIPRYGVVPPLADATGDVDAMAMYAGESAYAVRSIDAAADAVRRIVDEASELLDRATRLRAARTGDGASGEPER